VALSADGRYLAPGSTADQVFIYDLKDGKVLHRIREGHDGEMFDVCFSPDGKRLATASVKRLRGAEHPPQLRVYDVETGKQLLHIPSLTGEVPCVAFSPDGLRLAAGSYGAVTLFDALNGQEVLTLHGESKEFALRLGFVDGGRSLAASWQNSAGITLWDTHPPAQGGPLLAADDPAYHRQAAEEARTRRRWWAVLFHLERVPAAQREQNDVRERRAEALAELGRWQEAIAERERTVTANSRYASDDSRWEFLALANLAAGRTKEYREANRRRFSLFYRPEEIALLPAQTLLAPFNPLGAAAAVAGSRERGALYSAALAWALDPDREDLGVVLARARSGSARAAVLCRAGRLREALAECSRPLPDSNRSDRRLWKALIQQQLGDARARKTYDEAVRSLERPSAEDAKQTAYRRLDWKDRVAIDHLRREIERAWKKPR
jgi:tetratricopeptide (TPR) repeat protein